MTVLDYRKMLLLNTLIIGAFGIIFILLPKELSELNGFTNTVELDITTRFFGVGLIGSALFTLVLSEVKDSNILRNAGIAAIIFNGVGFLMILFGIFVNVGNTVFITNLIPIGVLVLGFGYLLATNASE